MKKRKVAFATGSRADYGIVRRYLKLLNEDQTIDLSLLVTGSLLDDTYGRQVSLIENDGFKIEAEIPLGLDVSSAVGIARSMACALEEFSRHFAAHKYDLLIILGDRYEMLSVAIAAAMQKIPILHIHGGEATFANYDEFIRHSITKMSLYHFVATEDYRRRVIQLGESPERVYNLGSLGAENSIISSDLIVPGSFDLPEKDYYVIIFHPETISSASPIAQIGELLAAVSELNNADLVFIGSNADTNADVIRDAIHEFVHTHGNAHYYENLKTEHYHYLVKNSLALVGNSSSGLIEAPSLGVYTINVGHRQAGRVRGASVIDVPCCKSKIIEAIKSLEGRPSLNPTDNPYYRPHASDVYYKTTLNILRNIECDSSVAKVFWDIDMENHR